MAENNTSAHGKSASIPHARVVRGDSLCFTPASHELPSDPGCLKKILARKDDLIVGQVQMINWSTIPPGKAFREHYHEDMQEIFVVISGTAEARAGGQTVTLTGGDTWIVDPGVKHSMSAVSNDAVVYLVLGITSGMGGKTVVTA